MPNARDERDKDREDGLPSKGPAMPKAQQGYSGGSWGTKPGPNPGNVKGRANETRGVPKVKTNEWESY